MIGRNEDALICDLAETYGIYDYRSLPVRTVATLSAGLRADSRIMMELAGEEIDIKIYLLSVIVDKLTLLLWQNSGAKGTMPKLITDAFEKEDNPVGFTTPEDFEKARQKIIGG